MTVIIELPVAQLVKADWNYKTDASPEQIEKLAASIRWDESAGVLAVRELGKNKYEVIDGNHRLEAVRVLKWETVPCENFGEISLARAVVVARRRNYQWFEDNILSLSKLMTDIVFPEIPIADLVTFMPDTAESLEALGKLTSDPFVWNTDGVPDLPPDQSYPFIRLRVALTKASSQAFLKVREKISQSKKLDTQDAERAAGQVVEYLLRKVK